jgi:hypothetical protein
MDVRGQLDAMHARGVTGMCRYWLRSPSSELTRSLAGGSIYGFQWCCTPATPRGGGGQPSSCMRAVTAMEVLRFAVLKPVHLPSPAVLNLARIRSWVAAGEECEDGGGGRTGGSRAKMYWQHYNLEAREENVTCPKPPSKTA